MSVLIVEKDARLGGVCTLCGCIPTKALLHTADLLEEARHGADVGVAAREVRLDLPAAMKHKEKVVRQSTNGVAYLMKKNRVDVADGFGRLAGPGPRHGHGSRRRRDGVRREERHRRDGLAPRSLPGMEIDDKAILSSSSILELAEVPKSLVVIGSGAVGVEFASMYARFGSKVDDRRGAAADRPARGRGDLARARGLLQAAGDRRIPRHAGRAGHEVRRGRRGDRARRRATRPRRSAPRRC